MQQSPLVSLRSVPSDVTDPPILPSFYLPPQILPEPPFLPRPILSIPKADIPAYRPLTMPPDELRPPVGVAKEGEEEETDKPKETSAPEVKKITVPWTDVEIPVPKEEIVVTAATTAAVSVVATLTATSMFNYLVKIFKPVFMQAVKRIQKKFGKDGKPTEEERPSEAEGRDG